MTTTEAQDTVLDDDVDVERLEVKTGNSSALLGMLAAETHPLQFLREYTTNAVEAIAIGGEESQPGRVVWDVDWGLVQASGGRLRKLSVTDTGCGMTGEQMVRLLNDLASSGKQLGATHNHGVGAKIAGVVVSPAGVVYSSWRDGQGSRVHFRQFGQGEHATYGLQVLRPNAEGIDRFIQPLGEEDKPYVLQHSPHGTQVTLLGVDEDDDTTVAPPSVLDSRRWVTKSLNSRYFRMPDDVEVLVREGNRFFGPDEWEAGATTRIRGMSHFLSDPGFVDAHGRVDLDDATAHWWLLNADRKGRARHSSEWISTGHIGVLHGDELYSKQDPASGGSSLDPTRGGYSALQEFGIQIGYERVVIYIEPTAVELVPNVARTELRARPAAKSKAKGKRGRARQSGSEPLPWSAWAERFRDRLPDELETLQLAAARQVGPDPEVIAARLVNGATFRRYMLPKHEAETRPSRHRRKLRTLHSELDSLLPPAGPPTPHAHTEEGGLDTATEASQTSVALLEPPAPDLDDERAGEPNETLATAATAPVDADAEDRADEGEDEQARAERERERQEAARQELLARFPDVVWVSMKDGTRPPGDLEDLAARMDPASGLLTINADFRGYTSLLEEMLDLFGGASPGAPLVVEGKVRELYLQQVLDAILKACGLAGSGRWVDGRVEEELLAPASLTLVLLAQHGLIGDLRKSLAQALGKLRKS